ncbi:MAG: ATP-grasp domain-containing protein [Pirellulaceae bacterium]
MKKSPDPFFTPRLAIVGASCRAMAHSATAAGFDCVAADLFADADLTHVAPTTRLQRYPADAWRWLQGQSVDGWMYGGGLENHPRLLRRLATLAPLWGCGEQTIRQVRDPWWLAEQCTKHGLTMPEMTRFRPASERDRWLYKPRRTAGGLGIALAEHVPPGAESSTAYWQKLTAGEPVSFTFFSTEQGTLLLGTARQWIGPDFGAPGAFQFAGAIAPWEVLPSVLNRVRVLAESLTQTAALRGLWGLDAIVAGEQVYPLEINPRPTATVELWERIWQHNWTAAHVQTFRTGSGPPEVSLPVNPTLWAKQILYVRQPGRMTDDAWQQLTTRFKTALDRDAKSTEIEIADIPPPGTPLEPGWPLLTVFACGVDIDTVRQRLTGMQCEVYRVIEGAAIRG